MTPEQFRTAGHQLIDWIADYRTTLDKMPVKAQVKPGEIRANFKQEAPTEISSFDELLTEMEQSILPGVTQVQHPMYFGWFPSNASLSSVLGDIASSGLATLGITWESCPSLTEVEEVVCDWMRQLAGLSDQWQGVIQDSASTTSHVCLLAARERATNYSQNSGGLVSLEQPLTVYCTSEAHSSVAKAALLAGFGMDDIRSIEVDEYTRAMKSEVLAAQIQLDIEQGYKPAVIIATVGTTGTTAIDPLDAIAELAQQHNIWLHVDAAMAGAAMVLPECRHLWSGIEGADSLVWNPHKWFGTILDCSLMYVRDSEHLIRVMSTNPSYLQSTADAQVTTQYRDWGIPLGRRFRSLKILFQLRLDGIESIQQRLRRDMGHAQWLVQQAEQADGWEVVAPVVLQTVCLRHRPNGLTDDEVDAHTLRWVGKINDSGAAFMSAAKVNDRWLVRVSIGAEATTKEHMQKLWMLLEEAIET